LPRHPARAVANEFIRLANEDGRPLTHMQIQKLVYITHGWNLAINGEALVDEQPRAWEYGPVYRSIYSALSSYGSSPISRRIRSGTSDFVEFGEGKPVVTQLSDSERAVLNRVYRDYGHYAAFQLSALTHADGTPWYQTYHSDGKNAVIDNQSIRDHFVEIANTSQN